MRKLAHAGPLLLAALIPAFLFAAGPSLVRNSSFEDVIGPGTMAEGWLAGNFPPGGVNSVTDAKARTGRFSHQLTVPDGVEVTWYEAEQTIEGAGPGKTYTLSLYVQTDNIRDGAGAYCSIGCYEASGNRIDYRDTREMLKGTVSEWRRLSTTMKVPAGTSKIKAILVLHGHGTAWFDDVQFEEGDVATEYRPSVADEEAAKVYEREKREAAGIFHAAAIPAGKKGVVAILRDSLPADGCASSPERLGGWLTGAGYAVAYLTGAQMSNRFVLQGPRRQNAEGAPPAFDLLVLPYGGTFPASGARALQNFLRHGGAFLSTGGYAFDTPLVAYEGKWYKPKDLPAPTTPVLPLVDFNSGGIVLSGPGSSGWDRGADAGGTLPRLNLVPGRAGAGRALEFSVTPLHAWATASIYMADRLPSPAATGGKPWAVTRFWAKGDADTPKMVVEWDETDASRWHCTIPLTTEGKEYVLSVADFTYWQDNPSVGRGGYGDHLHPENVTRFMIGMALDIVAADKPHSFQIDDLAVQADPLADLRVAPPCLNTRVGTIRDSMWPTPQQIPVFDPSHMLEFVRGARAAAGQFIVPAGASFDGPFDGYAAVGMTSNEGYGFGPNLARLVPILDGVDRFGRYRGPVGSLMHAYGGYYQGASWAFFGATNKDVFGDNPAARELFVNTADALIRRLYLHDTDTEFSSYRPGETVRFRTTVNNFDWRASAKGAAATVRLEVSEAGKSNPVFADERSLTMSPGASQQVVFEWKVPPVAADFYAFRATLLEGGKPVDREDSGVVIWTDRADRPAAPVGRKGPYFTLGDRPRFVVGCQTYWGQNGSVTARSPLSFERDYAMMQDYGLHFSRLFVPFKTDSDRRQSDAMVQLAQKHRILFYHTPNLAPTPVAADLTDEAATAKALGERYRGVPWLMVDICNEPSFKMTEDRMTGPYNEWLKAKYGTTEALRAAWGPDAPELGQVKPAPPGNRWDDLRTLDAYLFIAAIEKRWADSNRQAIQAADPTRLVAVGNLQGYGYADVSYDPQSCASDLDFSDRHFYGPPAEQARELKDIDMRVLGKPIVQGECGAKDHPTYAVFDAWMGDTDDKFSARFTSLVHRAFGVGAAALSSWHWRDPMEGIFPCGIVHADRVARPAASVMRAMAFTFGRLRPTFQTPAVLLVLPDSHRFGGARFAVLDAIHRAEDLLMSCQVDFAVLSENRLDKLPGEVRAIIYPVPYCPPDEAVAALKAFVAKGGALYFSGDISFAPARKLTRKDRLVELAGVERLGENYPNIVRDAKVAARLVWAQGTVLSERSPKDSQAQPAISLRLAGAQAVGSDGEGRPIVTINKLGAGQVMFCADPVETAPATLPWHRALYLDFLARANVARNPVEPDEPWLQCFRVPLEDGGRVFVLYNTGDAPAKATVTLAGIGPEARAPDRLALELAPNSPGLVVVGSGYAVTAVEAQGAVTRNGKTVAAIRGHAIIQSLDGKDVGAARQLLILPWPGIYGRPPQAGTPGEVAMASLASMRVELGELRETKWARLEPLKSGGGRITFDREQALNVILAAAPDQFGQAAGEVEALTLAR